MEEIKIRALEEKSNVSLTDLLIVEDNDGTKTAKVSALKSILQRCIFVDTIDDMKNSSFNEGDVVVTLGYRTKNDGGGGIYNIVYAPTDLNNDITIHYLRTSDTLRAHLVYRSSIDIMQAGAHADGVTDDYFIITKALSLGINISFPRRRFFVSSPIVLTNNTAVVDFGGATIVCPKSAALCLGLDDTVSGLTISNLNIDGHKGIELYPLASSINIHDCKIEAATINEQLSGIILNGCTDITIHNCVIGNSARYTAQGIVLNSGLISATPVGNTNIHIDGCDITASQKGISSASTITNNGIIISNCAFHGAGASRDAIVTVGIQFTSNDTMVTIRDCSYYKVEYGVLSASMITNAITIHNSIAYDAHYLYSIMSSGSTVILSGIHKSCGSSKSSATDYILEKMSGILILEAADIQTSPALVAGHIVSHFANELTGQVIDKNPVDSLIYSVLGDSINTFTNMAYMLNYATTITEDKLAGGVNGQILTFYATSPSTLISSAKLVLSDNQISISRFSPVKIKKINGIWYQIA